ncbi:MAG: ABC transporter substrate-binding protein [Pseudomonadota bacterium]|nr:ABC transporter substrate-binding protein [Pseudomonadota bacterium]
MKRRTLLIQGSAALLAAPTLVRAQALEKPELTIAVGGKNLLYYLPLTIAEQRGYFKDEGLDLKIVDFAGGSKALQAVVGGSADVVSGAFEHTVNMQFKGQFMRAFVLQGRAPQIVLGINPKTMPKFRGIADLKGKKIGVTAPGSSTNVVVNFLLARAHLKPSDVSIIGVGASQGAVAAMRSGQIDAISNLDPVITLLQRSGDLKIAADLRVVAQSDLIFGGPMLAACLYAPQAFVDKNPKTVQAMANAIVRADKWLQSAGPGDITKTVPESYQLGDRSIYIDAFLASKGAMSKDGLFPKGGPETAFKALASIDPELAKAKLDLSAVYTNEFAQRANAKYPKG